MHVEEVNFVEVPNNLFAIVFEMLRHDEQNEKIPFSPSGNPKPKNKPGPNQLNAFILFVHSFLTFGKFPFKNVLVLHSFFFFFSKQNQKCKENEQVH